MISYPSRGLSLGDRKWVSKEEVRLDVRDQQGSTRVQHGRSPARFRREMAGDRSTGPVRDHRRWSPRARGTTVWPIDQVGSTHDVHSTQKPVETVIRPVTYHTQAGDLTYERFAGSDTALVAADIADLPARPWAVPRLV